MKKISSFLLTFVLITSFTACSQQTERTMFNGIDISYWQQNEFADGSLTVSMGRTGFGRAEKGMNIRVTDVLPSLECTPSDTAEIKGGREYNIQLIRDEKLGDSYYIFFADDFSAMAVSTAYPGGPAEKYEISNGEIIKELFRQYDILMPRNTQILGTDLTPWLSQREGTDVWFAVSGRKTTGPDGTQSAYDIIPLLMDITVGQKLEYSDDMDDKLKAVNGEYVVALTDKNSERKLHLLTFYNEFTVMAATDDMKVNYYYITGTEKLKEYFADHNQYITPERYADIISCVNKYIAENEADYPQLNQNMHLEDFDVEIYGIKDAPSYHIYGEADDGNEDCDVHIRINADKAGALTVTDFNVYDN